VKSLTIERSIAAPLEQVWQVVSNLEDYALYAPNINTSEILSGNGVGMIRQCSSKEGCWQEVCTQWKEYASYSFDVQTQSKDYPYPFKTLQAQWTVESNDSNTTTIRMNFEVEFKNKLFGWMIFPIMKIKYSSICEKLLYNWQKAILQNHLLEVKV